ncbi:uncharacterized protein PAC_15612 [Phialocephala subalpina]|uniref:Uncharacterized protein n=1 Tax=Phialocephala subalpina TaxID=576137 RepID=A0A1L7XL01_9HELO|nr:uncharacterized protein PAC_15612 [Phialocephala subalpina]
MSGTPFKIHKYTFKPKGPLVRQVDNFSAEANKYINKTNTTGPITPDEVLRSPFARLAGRSLIRKTESDDPQSRGGIISKHIDLHAEPDESAAGRVGAPFMRNEKGLPPIRRIQLGSEFTPKNDIYIKRLDLEGHQPKLATDSKTKRLNAFFGVSLLFPHRYKDEIDRIKMEQQLKTRSFSVIKPLPAPEYSLYGRVPIGKLESVESAIRQLVARKKPFEIQFVPHYSRVTHEGFKRDKRPSAENFQVGLELTSADDEHVKLSNELAKAIWPTRKVGDRRWMLIIQPDMKTGETARAVWKELLDEGIRTFMVRGLVLTTQIFLEQERRYETERRVFILKHEEEIDAELLKDKSELDNT